MRKIYVLWVLTLLLCASCEWRLKSNEEVSDRVDVSIERYDMIESVYLTTGDYSALLQMNKTYPTQTRMLIEDVLHIGQVNEPDINHKFLNFFGDSTLQTMIVDVQRQYADMEDLNHGMTKAFERLREMLPSLEVPQVYAQIGSFDQSIIVGNKTLGISLDKYLGADYPFYVRHYSEQQRQMMTRSMIIPDCIAFYVLSQYPPLRRDSTMQWREQHMGKIQWVVNEATDRQVFRGRAVTAVESYMKRHKRMSVEELLRDTTSL